MFTKSGLAASMQDVSPILHRHKKEEHDNNLS
jgi:hypothetical protein